VIERNIPDQLGGTADIRWLPVGLSCEFAVPGTYIVQMQPRVGHQALRA
jgi:hypothetical protein